MPDFSKVSEAMLEAAADPAAKTQKSSIVFPGAVLLVAQNGEVLFHEAFGARSLVPETTPMTRDMVFDIASLTKALVTTTIAMHAVDHGHFTFDTKVSRILQTFGTFGKDRIQIQHLLNHTSGYPAFTDYVKILSQAENVSRRTLIGSRSAADFIFNDLQRAQLPIGPGVKTVYSDLGFILLGHICEVIFGGLRLDRLAERIIFKPLRLRSMAYVDLETTKRRGIKPVTDVIVPTVNCPWRERVLCGEVDDGTAYAMGGIAGHAGIFSAAKDIHEVAWELLQCYRGEGSMVSQDTVRQFWTHDGMDPKSSWARGWDMRSDNDSSSGRFFGPNSVGHLGFTGCSLWIDPEKELEVILLSNRVHPTYDNVNIREFRPKIHDLVMEALGYAS